MDREPHHGFWPLLGVLRVRGPSEAPLETSGSLVKACNPPASISTNKMASDLHAGEKTVLFHPLQASGFCPFYVSVPSR